MTTFLQILAITFMAFQVSTGYKAGPPESVCVSMTPSATDHGAAPQTSVAPYKITAVKVADTKFKVTIKSNNNNDMEGLMMHGEDKNSEPFGTFEPITKTKLMCSKKTIAHSDELGATELSINWVAPSADAGPVTFKATILEGKKTFWVGVKSAQIQTNGTIDTNADTKTGMNNANTFSKVSTGSFILVLLLAILY